jgi:hypothetical protein
MNSSTVEEKTHVFSFFNLHEINPKVHIVCIYMKLISVNQINFFLMFAHYSTPIFLGGNSYRLLSSQR